MKSKITYDASMLAAGCSIEAVDKIIKEQVLS